MKMTNPNLIEINDPHFIVELMYAGTNHNMTGQPVYQQIGFGNKAFVHKDLWDKLKNLIPFLEQKGWKLKIYDAYRPPLARIRNCARSFPNRDFLHLIPLFRLIAELRP